MPSETGPVRGLNNLVAIIGRHGHATWSYTDREVLIRLWQPDQPTLEKLAREFGRDPNELRRESNEFALAAAKYFAQPAQETTMAKAPVNTWPRNKTTIINNPIPVPPATPAAPIPVPAKAPTVRQPRPKPAKTTPGVTLPRQPAVVAPPSTARPLPSVIPPAPLLGAAPLPSPAPMLQPKAKRSRKQAI